MDKQVRNRRGRLGQFLRSNVAGLLALVVALSVTPAIASHLTVETSDLKKNAVTAPKIKKNAVTTAKIKNGAVKPSKLSKLPKRQFVGTSGAAPFFNGGQNDCVWSPASMVAEGLVGPNYYKDHMGLVHLSGLAIAEDGPGGDATCDHTVTGQETDGIVFILPPAFRPQFTEIHGVAQITTAVVSNTPLVLGTLVLPPGAVYSSADFAPPQALLDGITYRTGSGGSAGRTASGNRASEEVMRRLLGLD